MLRRISFIGIGLLNTREPVAVSRPFKFRWLFAAILQGKLTVSPGGIESGDCRVPRAVRKLSRSGRDCA
jgi:hypothetical protein